jgi:hypothetical protein
VNYWTNLFTPATYEAFSQSDRSISGFRESQRHMAQRVQPGDVFVCYMVYLSRWIGVLEALEGPFVDRSPRFVPDNDPFVVRFRVRCRVWLSRDQTIPIHEQDVYSHLTFTRNLPQGGYWLGPLRRSLQQLNTEDGDFLCRLLEQQQAQPRNYPVDDDEYQRHLKRRIQRADGPILVTVPEDRAEDEAETDRHQSDRESVRMQAAICQIGETMGFKIWLPAADRSRVLAVWSPQPGVLLDKLPLNYDETTLDTIQRIDVLWLKGRAIRRAFEIEHSTSIYSGLLRMADLCALLPNINVPLHIVAPEGRRSMVFHEITRPVFSLIENTPLSKRCTYLSYASVEEILNLDYLAHTTDSILDEFAEYAE